MPDESILKSIENMDPDELTDLDDLSDDSNEE